MDPELKRLLEETHALAKDNNRILHAIRRERWIGLIFNILVWTSLIVLPLYYYQTYLQPEVSKFFLHTGVSTSTGAFGLPSSADMQKLIESYKVGK